MEKALIDQLRKEDITEAVTVISSACRVEHNFASAIYASTYVIMRANEDYKISIDSVDLYLKTAHESDSRAQFITDNTKYCWNNIRELKFKFTLNQLKAVLLFYEAPYATSEYNCTPISITQLAIRLMDIKPGDKVADLATGRGSFIRECYCKEPLAEYYGNDINHMMLEVASIRAELLGKNVRIKEQNILDMENCQRQFDTVFTNYPFALNAHMGYVNDEQINTLMQQSPEFSKVTYMDWIFNKYAYSCVAGPRRVVCLMTNGSTLNNADKAARKYFVKRGIVEAVIALPVKMFENTNVSTVMVVFSHGNTSVMMVDAREIFLKGRRLNNFSYQNIDDIYNACLEEGNFSKKVCCDEIQDNDYILNPIRYLNQEFQIDNGIPFDSVINKMTRGAQVSAAKLDDMVSEDPTNTQYLMLSNIKDGIIDEELPYIKSIDSKLEKYCVKNNSLIISKNGYPFKIAVAEINEGKKVLANGNLFIIELDETKAEPYFIKAYLESDKGISILKSIVVGSSIPNIGLDQLKKIQVPGIPLKDQIVIADKYRELVNKIVTLKNEINVEFGKIKTLFNDNIED